MKLRRRTIGGSPGSWLTAGSRSEEALLKGGKHFHLVKLSQKRLTQLSALAGRLEQQLQLVQDQRHVHGVAAESLHPEQEGHRRLELSRQEQHLEIEEGLLAGGEMGLSCWEEDRGRSFILKDLQTGNGLVGHTKSSFHHMPHIRTRTRSSFFILDQSGEVSDDSQSQKKSLALCLQPPPKNTLGSASSTKQGRLRRWQRSPCH